MIAEPPITADDNRKALAEVSFLLEIFAATVDELMGGATASIGRIAGRHQARRLPVFLPDASPADAVAAVSAQGQLGIRAEQLTGDEITIGHCAIRRVCEERSLALGGELCRLYHFYLDGVVNELAGRPLRSAVVGTGADQCRVRLESR